MVKEIKESNIDGLLIKNVLPPDQVDGFTKGVNQLNSELKNKVNSGLTIFPESFS